MKLATHYVEKPWGRADLPAGFAAEGRKVGEVWFDAPDHALPILVKWLFTSEKLSVQVHPDDGQARARGLVSGKEECWVIVSAEPGARLGIGTQVSLNADELRAASQSGAIEALMDWKPVAAGDYFYIPAGTVHAIGAGVTLVEVQQNADITYRLFDYGRPRELHLEDGVAVSRAGPYTDARSGRIDGTACQTLVAGPIFTLVHARGEALQPLLTGDGARWVIPLEGEIIACGRSYRAGDCLYIGSGALVSVSNDASVLVAQMGAM